MTYRSASISVLPFTTYLFSAASKVIAMPFQSFTNQLVIYNTIYHSYYRLIECFILQKECLQINPRVFNQNSRVSFNNPWVFYNNRWVYSNNRRVFSQNPRVSDENRRHFIDNPSVFNHFRWVSEKNPRVLQENSWVFNKNPWVNIKVRQLNAILSFTITALTLHSIILYLTARL